MDDRQREILIIAQEECAEVIQEISKIFRFGINEIHKDGLPHQEKLEQEVGDLLCMINLMTQYGLIRADQVAESVNKKQFKLKQWSKIYD